ncbi:MAG TPA: hypothetical protein VHN14_08590 [Kofleriaceae bacterium]|nr:hypothetical protein [Kofleriaceae bacterium]
MLLVGMASAAWADPPATPVEGSAAGPVVPHTCRGAAPYFESSAFATSRTERINGTLSPPSSALLGRLAAGVELRHCREDTSDVHLRLGLALTVAGEVFGGDTPGAGVETEASYPVTPALRLGARLGADRLDDGTLFTFGLRLRVHDLVYLGVDGFRGVDSALPSPRARTSAMIGVGLEGRAGIPLAVGVLVACGYAVLNSINLR